MTHLLKLTGALILTSLLFTSCKEDCDTTVTQLAAEDARWLVYDQGDMVHFLNENGDSVLYMSTLIRADQVPGEDYKVSDDCIKHYDVQAFSIIEDKAKKYKGFGTYFVKGENSMKHSLLVEGNSDVSYDPAQPTHASMEVNGKVYTNVIEEVRTDDSKATNLKRLLFNQEFGFLSVEFFDGKKLELLP